MCIALITTAHPDYALILLNNRDEYLSRPTHPAAFWSPPYDHVLGGRDAFRSTQGTWLGLTRDGRIAVLTNFHEPDSSAALGTVSRGEMVKAYLCPPPLGAKESAHLPDAPPNDLPGAKESTNLPGAQESTDLPGAKASTDLPSAKEFAELLVRGSSARGSGGFTLVCGRVGAEDLAVVSNRMTSSAEIGRIRASGETVALSNAAFGDRTWPKVARGEALLGEAIAKAEEERWRRERLIEEMFELLGVDDMPGSRAEESQRERMMQLRKSIFVPVIKPDAVEPSKGNDEERDLGTLATTGAYGTRQQTVVLVGKDMDVTYVERTLFDESAGGGPKDRRFEFRIENRA